MLQIRREVDERFSLVRDMRLEKISCGMVEDGVSAEIRGVLGLGNLVL